MNYKKEMTEKKNELITRADAVLDKAKAEKRELTEDEAAELDEIRDNVQKIVNSIKLYDAFASVTMGVSEAQPKQDDTPTDDAPVDSARAKDADTSAAQKDRDAFENYLRGRVVHERAGELTKTDNGAVIPTSIAQQIVKKVYDVSPVLAQSTRYNVPGNLTIPYYDDTTSTIRVAYQDEFKPLTSSTGSFKSIDLTGFLAGALTKVSLSLINNAQFDIVNFVVDEMSASIARFIDNELLVGTVGKVTGLSSATNKVITASATAVTADEIIRLHDSVKDAYQDGAMFVMNAQTRTALRLLKGSDGKYLLNDDVSSPFGTSILGKPVYVSDALPTVAAGKAVAYYGNFKGLATKFSENINIQVLRERYADEHAVGVIGWFEFDSKIQNQQAIAQLVCKTA